MNELKTTVADILQNAAQSDLSTLLEAFITALESHPQALEALKGSYRVQATDTGVHCAIALSAGGLQRLEASTPVDVCLLATEDTFLRIVRGQLAPPLALLTGKLKIKGSALQLGRFAPLFG